MAHFKDRDTLTPNNRGTSYRAVGGAFNASIGQGPVFGTVGLGRVEKGGVFVLNAGNISHGIAGGASAVYTGRTVSINLFGLQRNPLLGSIVTSS